MSGINIFGMLEKMIRRLRQLMASLAVASEKPLMVIGPSAVGKDTMINRLKNKYPNVIYKLPSYTTRPMRSGETDGVDYFFVTKEKFFQLKNKGELFGIQEYNNNWYSSNKKRLEEIPTYFFYH